MTLTILNLLLKLQNVDVSEVAVDADTMALVRALGGGTSFDAEFKDFAVLAHYGSICCVETICKSSRQAQLNCDVEGDDSVKRNLERELDAILEALWKTTRHSPMAS